MADLSNIIGSGPQERNRQLQWYEQTGFYNYGPADPTFANVGVVTSVTPTLNIAHKETRVVGSRKLYSDRKLMKEGTVEVVYEMLNTIMPRYGINDPAGAGTIEKPLTFLESSLVNGAQRYRLYRDCITETIAFALQQDFVVTQNFYASNITNWMTETALKTELTVVGTDTINFAPALTGEPWNHLDSQLSPANAGSPVDVNGDIFLFQSLNVEVNNNLRKLNPGGYDQTKYISPGNKVITGSFSTWLGDGIVMEDHVRNFDSTTLTLKIKENTNNDVNMVLTGVKFNSMSDSVEAGANEFSVIEYPFTCSDVTLTAFP